MPSFLPKKRVDPAAVLKCVDLDELFFDMRFSASLARVTAFIAKIQAGYSDNSFDHVGRPGIITEVFFFAMPTVAAYVAQIELMNGIQAHALGNMNDEKIKVYLQKYLDAHTFVYREENQVWKQEFKTGYSKRTGGIVDLFYIEYEKLGSGQVLNLIQVKLWLLIQKHLGNDAKYTISKL